jgi:hypothetical protein
MQACVDLTYSWPRLLLWSDGHRGLHWNLQAECLNYAAQNPKVSNPVN